MSRLEELINELCPNGVEYKTLGDIATFSQGIQVEVSKQFTEPFDNCVQFLRIVDFVNENEIPRYIEKPDNKYIKEENEMIMIRYGANAAGKVFINKTGAIANNMFKINLKNNEINIKYLQYYLSQEKIYTMLNSSGKSTMPAINFNMVSKISVPVPPLEVQNEIVHILDDFTLLSAELSAELKARQKQYEYYKVELLNSKSVEYKKLKDVADIYLGLTATPKYEEKGIKFLSSLNISKDFLDLENVKYISEETFKKATSNAKPQRGDVLFVRVGSNLGHPVVYNTDEKTCIFVSVGFVRVKDKNLLNSSYLRYWMSSNDFMNQVYAKTKNAPKANLNTTWMKEFNIPIPSIDYQNKVVNILDRFDKLCNDISEGIPAEIEARQKQYEYYRDKLLSFKELVNEQV